jgi:ubiquinone/menaquinone biosynthesis C-methylase UbiE
MKHFDQEDFQIERKNLEYWQQAAQKFDLVDIHPYINNISWRKKYTALVRWVDELSLHDKLVLEVGSGLGLLQHVVSSYVGVDVSPASGHRIHKPFCAADATKLPFPDNTFDAVWSVYVLEHIPNPEAMLSEIRRVLKPGGSVFLCAAYSVDSWVSQGLHKRPFAELTVNEKLIKATIPVRSSKLYKIARSLPQRSRDFIMYLMSRNQTQLRYDQLRPNFEIFWDYDADACASIDAYSVVLYFLSRGDRPLYGAGVIRSIFQRSQPQAYIINK